MTPDIKDPVQQKSDIINAEITVCTVWKYFRKKGIVDVLISYSCIKSTPNLKHQPLIIARTSKGQLDDSADLSLAQLCTRGQMLAASPRIALAMGT